MKYLNLIYYRQTLDYLKRNGMKNVLNKIPEYMITNRGYQTWRKKHTPSSSDLAGQKDLAQKLELRPLFSILVPAYQTDPLQLKQMAESVFSQTYGNWELCIADGSPKPSAVEDFFLSYARDHGLTVTSSETQVSAQEKSKQSQAPVLTYPCGSGRVWFASARNLGIAGNTNAAMALASGDYIVLLDHDDLLSPDALYELAQAINHDPSADVLYSDEDMVSADGSFFHNPNFKPDYNPDLLRSCNYITHLYAVRRTLALQAGGFSEECDGSQDYDFILKTVEKAGMVCHIPKVLYHWRIHPESVAADSDNKAYAYGAAVRALQSHYDRCGIQASVSMDPQPGFYLTDYMITGRPLVSILLYHCEDSLKETLLREPTSLFYTTEFPDSISAARGEYVLVLRQIRGITSDTIRMLLSNCMRPEIGIAAARILTTDEKVLESGLTYNSSGKILSPFAGKDPDYPGYHRYAVCQRQISLAGPHCFMTTMENLRRNWRGKNHSDINNSQQNLYSRMAEFCFQTLLGKKQITLVPQADAILTKSGSRQASNTRKAVGIHPYLREHPVDPFYTPNFSQKHPYRFSSQSD